MKVHSIHDLENVIQGLSTASQKLLHLTIIAHIDIINIWRILKSSFDNHGFLTSVRTFYDVLQNSLAEHAASVRAFEVSGQETILQLTTLGQFSEAMLTRATEAAKNAFIGRWTLTGPYGNDRETTAGKTLTAPVSIEESGRYSAYKRKSIKSSTLP